ncbi:putative vacuolar membrane protein [Trichoderma ghanense]|uniref:Vacuolar membrane protein n=1 Tax=Trichoderma ghanense TaxID=65468 RepID=A0ABY2GXH1_9HYPO
MGCLSHRKKETRQYTDQKWDYINLSDFKAKGCGAIFAYITLWMGLIISLAVYGVDTFTAVQLLVFNRWSSEIEPAIPLSVSRWIFSGCIILSFINLGFEWVRAARKIKRGNVAEVYLDSLAVRWESIRLGSGQGFKRFLVFGELTKSKKGVEYIALFTYFSFQSWIRVLFCTSPRQVVNALTLRSVYMARLAVSSDSVEGSISAFFDKIKTLAQSDFRQAAILGGMCFTLVVWVFSALYLISAALFYVFFLFHWIPRTDGGLTGYCERKVNSALLKIVTKTVNQALAKGQADRMKRAMTEKGDAHPDASLPTLPNVNRLFTSQQAGVTPPLPAYTSNPGTPAGDFKRQMPPRSMTGASTMSYSSRAPLVNSAADMGYTHTRSASPENMAPTVPYLQRTGTGESMRSNGSPPDLSHMRNGSNSSYYQPRSQSPPNNGPPLDMGHVRSGSISSSYHQQPYSQSPASMGPVTASPMYTPAARPIPPRADYNSYSQNMQDDNQSLRGPPPRSYTFNNEGRSSPAPSAAGSSYSRAPQQPVRSATNQVPLRGLRFAPQRQMTEPVSGREPTDSYYSGTGPRMPPNRQPLRQNSQNFYSPQTQAPYGASYRYDVEAQNDGRY